MSVDVFFDTNVLVYSTVRDDPRSKTAKALMAGGGVVSVQVLNEFASVASRKLRWTWNEIADAVASFSLLCPNPRPLTFATHMQAIDIARRTPINFYDALIVAAALQAECAELLTEDLQHGRVFAGRLTVRNPFAAA